MAVPSSKMLLKKLVGVSLILMISIWTIITILIPGLLSLFSQALLSKGLLDWTAALGGLGLVAFLIAYPILLILQGISSYKDARLLEKLGILTSGWVIDKWVDDSEGRAIYYIRYKYLNQRNALQRVSKDVFQRLARNQGVKVLILEHMPHISRILL